MTTRTETTVYVIMGNDFPEAVFSEFEDARAFIDKKKLECNWINWRSYAFKLDERK
jgi:hypothetical protein